MLYGGVGIEIHGKLGPVVYCHCSQCRRASGSAFAANASACGRRTSTSSPELT
jgi:hypothetical protein